MNDSDQIIIRDLPLHCIVGVNEWERATRQTIVLNLIMDIDLRRSGTSDDLDDTVDYQTLQDELVEKLEKTSFFLIERLAEEAARILLQDPLITQVDLTLDKPFALKRARSAAVRIVRSKGSAPHQ